MDKNAQIEAILAILPQTQCGECGFPGCKPYAEAIASKKAAINLCPPGGLSVLHELSKLTHETAQPLEAALTTRLIPPQVALINEAECIGCTKCIQACPVDAIYGAAKQMHVVLTDQCTGCTLCVAPCPVDCITMIPAATLSYNKKTARNAYENKLLRGDFKRAGMLALSEQHQATSITAQENTDRKRFIAEAVARVKAKKQ